MPPTQKKTKNKSVRVWGKVSSFGIYVKECTFSIRCNKAQEATCAVKGNSVGVIDPDSKPMYVQV